MEIISIHTLYDIQNAARDLLRFYHASRIFAFYGEMGVGKTTFIKALCKELKVTENISSPSFALIHEYKSNLHGTVYHFDFYRIKTIEEAFDLGYEDYIYSGHYCFIEWPEKVESLLPADTIHLNMYRRRDHSRFIKQRD